MEENFNPVARTRANYYTPGSPVQFVCVELLKGELSGENAVCLTFKNISKVTLTALEIHFKCKGVDGIILCEDAFEYREIEVKPGESFGMDDAVFVTQKAITSVDVVLKNVYSGKKVVHLDAIKRVRLPAPRRLSPELEKALESRMNRSGLKYMPQVFENGWYCACGSFHPKEEDTVYCTECGCDRILLQNALNTLLQPGQKAAPAEQAPAAEATRVASVSGSDLFPLLCKMAAEKGYKMFFLGAAEGVAAKAAKNLMNRFKGLQVVGTYSPPFGFEKDPVEMDKIKSMIKASGADILIVGLGCPKQEKFMYHHCAELGVPISFGLGASFDFEAGNIKRAPRWMANHGLEWLFRITQDPERMAKRYLVDDRKIIGLAIKYRRRK